MPKRIWPRFLAVHEPSGFLRACLSVDHPVADRANLAIGRCAEHCAIGAHHGRIRTQNIHDGRMFALKRAIGAIACVTRRYACTPEVQNMRGVVLHRPCDAIRLQPPLLVISNNDVSNCDFADRLVPDLLKHQLFVVATVRARFYRGVKRPHAD